MAAPRGRYGWGARMTTSVFFFHGEGMLHAMTTQQYQLHEYSCMAMLHDCMGMHSDVERHDSTML